MARRFCSSGTPRSDKCAESISRKILSIVAEGPVSKVLVDVGFLLTAIITRQACEELQLSEGEKVIVLFKAHGVHLVPRA